MTAGVYHFQIEQGSTFLRTITYKDSAGSPIDLSTYTARMQLRKNIEDASAILELTTSNGRITLGGAAGTVQLTVSAADTASLDPVEGVYDLELVVGSTVEKLLKGTFSVIREVTR